MSRRNLEKVSLRSRRFSQNGLRCLIIIGNLGVIREI
jgi:hypothetical protein